MAAAGPGVVNLASGLAHAWADQAPVIAIGGSSATAEKDTLGFQDLDQVGLFAPITRWAGQCLQTVRIPEYIAMAFRAAFAGHPGPVYLDLPGDVLYAEVPESEVRWTPPADLPLRSAAIPEVVDRAADLLAESRAPVLVYGSGVLWSRADESLREVVEQWELPFFATPQARGVVDEGHELSFLGARSAAFRDCDLIVQVGTRQNYVFDRFLPPRWNDRAALIQIDSDPAEVGRNRRPDAALVGDVDTVLKQLLDRRSSRVLASRVDWRSSLERTHAAKSARPREGSTRHDDGRPMHPLELCYAVRDLLPDDAVLVVDGQEILNFARQSIPFRMPRSLNSGNFGMMGVGLPLGLGAQAALPDAPVVVLHGDGSFGMNGFELDTAIRHSLPVVCIISNNAGWTARDRPKPGRELGFTRYDLMFGPLGVHVEYVEDPASLPAAITRALGSGLPALINVATDPEARAGGTAYTSYTT
jgi:acetolactate synthase-1/2/3 large subunit